MAINTGTILKIIVGALWKFVLKTATNEEIQKVFEDYTQEWCEKHLTPEELKNETNDFIKLIKSKL